nr:hypothetical protein Iba_chr02eCG7320 [Ipomoea batatas]
MRPRPRKKLVAQKPVQPYVLSLDIANEFGIRAEVEDMVDFPEWRYLLMDFAEDTYKAVLVEVMTTMKLPKFDGLTSNPSRSSSSLKNRETTELPTCLTSNNFGKSSRMAPRYTRVPTADPLHSSRESTSSCNICSAIQFVADLMPPVLSTTLTCSVFMAWSSVSSFTWRIVLVEPKDPGMQPLIADAVTRTHDKIWPKRACTAGVTDERMEEEAYEAHPDAVAPVYAEAGGNSSSSDFSSRLDDMEAANAQSRAEAHAYYEWMRGHYPPQGGPPFPPFDPSSMG